MRSLSKLARWRMLSWTATWTGMSEHWDPLLVCTQQRQTFEYRFPNGRFLTKGWNKVIHWWKFDKNTLKYHTFWNFWGTKVMFFSWEPVTYVEHSNWQVLLLRRGVKQKLFEKYSRYCCLSTNRLRARLEYQQFSDNFCQQKEFSIDIQLLPLLNQRRNKKVLRQHSEKIGFSGCRLSAPIPSTVAP